MKARILLTVALLFGGLLPAAAAPSYGPPKPDFAPMTYFVGLWNCTRLKSPDPTLVGTKFSYAGATDSGGYWEVMDLQNGRINITRDAQKGLWTFIYLGNGGDYGVMTTPGWSGKTLTLTEVLTYGRAPQGQASFTKLSDAKFRINYTARGASGMEQDETECTRV
jgi:hypothetical protein